MLDELKLSEKLIALKALEDQRDALDEKIDAIKSEIKTYMKEIKCDSLTVETFRITYHPVNSIRLDSKKIQEDYPDIAQGYLRPSTCWRLTISCQK